jgi:formylglycine-generating enzyme required for sulfatase activity
VKSNLIHGIFGDSTSSSFQNTKHVYSSSGKYYVSVLVTDDLGATNASGVNVIIEQNTAIIDDDLVDLGNLGMEFVRIEGGTFLMGDHKQQQYNVCYLTNEETMLPREESVASFYIQTTEVTVSQWMEIMGRTSLPPGNSSEDCEGPKCPVSNVTYWAAHEFIGELNMRAADKNIFIYELPTQAQWEFACRGGTELQDYYFENPSDIGQYVWHFNNSGNKKHPVGLKLPNVFGLYDMLGNLAEWCLDGCAAPIYIVRGGAYNLPADQCVVYYKNDYLRTDISSEERQMIQDEVNEDTMKHYVGFRLVKMHKN